jgi:hypothetical protein
MPGNAAAIEGRCYSPALYPQGRAHAHPGPGNWLALNVLHRLPGRWPAQVPYAHQLKQFASESK